MKGAEIGFSMAIHLKEVIATVLINEPSFTLDIPQIYHDQINQPLPFSPSLLSVSALGHLALDCSLQLNSGKHHLVPLPVANVPADSYPGKCPGR
ncbi:hypothetical protein AB1E18_006946 [Capra hircus]